ncbi:MAG: hypothetical protein QOD77_1098 [Thermoplasmata archaeon]|jgi:N-acetylglutamate synthase-like GNAT family acetyltransferase|nr:hypothetical protein [Thermoplasmata archaeon]
MTNPVVRPCHPAERGDVVRLLEEAGLPLDGLDAAQDLWVATVLGRVVGAVGFERHGRVGLLRSLVVADDCRGMGIGGRLLERGVRSMRGAGLTDAYGLTTTIPALLAKKGWTELRRDQAPAALAASAESQGACPASARLFHLHLAAIRASDEGTR